MVKYKVIMTQDGTGNHKTPDVIVKTFEREFESVSAAWAWSMEQNNHPWYTTHLELLETT